MNHDSPLVKAVKAEVVKVERAFIASTLMANNWNRKRTAAVLGISYRALLYKIKALGIGAEGG